MSQHIVTTSGKPARRYVLVDHDRDEQAAEIKAILEAEREEAKEYADMGWQQPRQLRPFLSFGARWVQSRNRANECYRSLSVTEVKSIKTVADGTVALTP